jgi:hypothetical protein
MRLTRENGDVLKQGKEECRLGNDPLIWASRLLLRDKGGESMPRRLSPSSSLLEIAALDTPGVSDAASGARLAPARRVKSSHCNLDAVRRGVGMTSML